MHRHRILPFIIFYLFFNAAAEQREKGLWSAVGVGYGNEGLQSGYAAACSLILGINTQVL